MQEKFHYPLPRDGVKSIQQAIRKVRFEKNEHLYVFKNGSQILRFAGHQNQINIPPEYLFQLKDTEVVHNHTSNSSFSFEDIKALCCNPRFHLPSQKTWFRVGN